MRNVQMCHHQLHLLILIHNFYSETSLQEWTSFETELLLFVELYETWIDALPRTALKNHLGAIHELLNFDFSTPSWGFLEFFLSMCIDEIMNWQPLSDYVVDEWPLEQSSTVAVSVASWVVISWIRHAIPRKLERILWILWCFQESSTSLKPILPNTEYSFF